MMKTSCIATLSLIHLILLLSSSASADRHRDFLECLSHESHTISDVVYTNVNSSYTSILHFSIRNLRFATETTPKPLVIITPDHQSQIPPLIYCAKQSALQIRTRSGGHDFEGLSYVSRVPFAVIDLINLSNITVDVAEKTAWIGAGATLGSLYYRIAEKSPILGFPAGLCPTVGVGGHFSGGGYGTMQRKFGLAADQVIDAIIVDVHGRILNRKSMGEDLFWAIRGGGGASFGVILSWKVRLVDVPEKVTVFTVDRSLDQNAAQLIHRWQYVAPKLDPNLFIGILLSTKNSNSSNQGGGNNTVFHASFYSHFLGGVDELLALMQEGFPELGLVREDCSEMSWIESALYFAQFSTSAAIPDATIEVLLNRTPPAVLNIKIKSDYVQKPIPENGLQGLVRLLHEPDANEATVVMIPYGGRMAEIPESATPFPHRAGNLCKVSCIVSWQGDEARDSERYIRWIRRYYSYMTPYVSSSPREAYLNYRDLDIGVNNIQGSTSYAQASIWGKKYFKNNFHRLVRVKTIADPHNFFKNEQSIPPFHSMSTENRIEPEAVRGSDNQQTAFASI